MIVAQAQVGGQVLVADVVLDEEGRVAPRALLTEIERLTAPGEVIGREIGIICVRRRIVESRVGDSESEDLVDREALEGATELEVVVAQELGQRDVHTVVVETPVGVRCNRRIARRGKELESRDSRERVGIEKRVLRKGLRPSEAVVLITGCAPAVPGPPSPGCRCSERRGWCCPEER